MVKIMESNDLIGKYYTDVDEEAYEESTTCV